MERPWHNRPAASVLAALRTGRDGLSDQEADRRARAHGRNELPRERADGWPRLALRQFASPLMLLLLVAGGVSAVLGDMADAWIILAAALLNAVVGFFQEYKASRTLESIRSLVRPVAAVRRDGRERVADAASLVSGDILVLRAGDRVAADARIVASWACETNEAALTGESLPVAKDPAPVRAGALLAERHCMVYAGTIVVAGRAEAAVTAVGIGTELGAIAELVSGTREGSTPLQDELRRLSAWIGIGAVVIVVALFALGVATGRPAAEMFRMSVALAVAAVPEGLLLSVTVVLAVGMRRILARGSLVRRLVAAETLGSVSVICTDKTGTLTLGEMRVAEVVPSEGASVRPAETPLKAARGIVGLLEAAMLCNDAVVQEDAGVAPAIGSPTDVALMEAGRGAGIDPLALASRHERFAEIPFDSARKDMATLNAWQGGRTVILKGAPEKVLERSLRFAGKDGSARPLSGAIRHRLEATLSRMGQDGLRVIALAMKPSAGHASIRPGELEGMTFLGFMGLRDPLRQEARAHVLEAAKAGLRTVIITGDHPQTARVMAMAAGIRTKAVVTGAELDALDDAALARRVSGISVYARVEPRHKIRIVRAWRARGAVVAMVGDGVNDAPALKAADVGVALGSGTEVAKEAADIVLLDNDLGTITAAVEQGRILFDNIRRVSAYLLVSCFTEIVLIGAALVGGLPLPLTPLHILWINLVADTFPGAALTVEPGERGIMREPPRGRHEPVLDRPTLRFVFLVGLGTDFVLFLAYLWLLSGGSSIEHARTVLFASVGFTSVIHAFSLKSFRLPVWKIPLSSNPWLVAAVGAGVALMALTIWYPPLAAVFGNVPLGIADVALVLAVGAFRLVGIEGLKSFALSKRRARG